MEYVEPGEYQKDGGDTLLLKLKLLDASEERDRQAGGGSQRRLQAQSQGWRNSEGLDKQGHRTLRQV